MIEAAEIETKLMESDGLLTDDSIEDEEGLAVIEDNEAEISEQEKETLDVDHSSKEIAEKSDNDKKDERRRRNQTRIREFNFQKREKIIIQKITKSKKIRELVLKKSMDTINKRSKMSKKMIIKNINNIYSSLMLKYKQENILDDLLEFIYQEFEPNYSLKKVVERKVMDFLCNLIHYSDDSPKIKNFIKFLDLSEKISTAPFVNRKESLYTYISFLD